jgi:hypothetical protein
MLRPEIMELCNQASVEQDLGGLLHFIGEINRLIAVRDGEHLKRFATCNPDSEERSQIPKSPPPAQVEPSYALGVESR